MKTKMDICIVKSLNETYCGIIILNKNFLFGIIGAKFLENFKVFTLIVVLFYVISRQNDIYTTTHSICLLI